MAFVTMKTTFTLKAYNKRITVDCESLSVLQFLSTLSHLILRMTLTTT